MQQPHQLYLASVGSSGSSLRIDGSAHRPSAVACSSGQAQRSDAVVSVMMRAAWHVAPTGREGVSPAGRSIPRLPAPPPRSSGPRAPLHGDRAEAFVEPVHLHPEPVGTSTTAVDECFEPVSGVVPDLPVAAGAAGGAAVDGASRLVESFGSLDFESPQVEIPQGCALFPRATGAVPVHRRGRGCPFGSMCVMCGAVTWRGR